MRASRSSSPARPATAPGRVLRRQCACGAHGAGSCEGCRKKGQLQRSATGAGPEEAPAIVQEVLAGQGRTLDAATRTRMEKGFGRDFSGVRVHTGAQAAASADAVRASAYAVGRDLVFAEGRYRPGSAEGDRLLAHELAHVAQQEAAPAAGPLRIGSAHDPAERAADSMAEAALGGRPRALPAPAAPALRRAEAKGPESHFTGCDEATQSDLKTKHPQAISHVDGAIRSLSKGWAGMEPQDKDAFTSTFDPSNSGSVDEGFVKDVRENFGRIRAYMGSLTFNCDKSSFCLFSSSESQCKSGRLFWTCGSDVRVCHENYSGSHDDWWKIRGIIHECTHNALRTTDRAYFTNKPEFQQLKPRGEGVLGFLSRIPVLGALFKLLPGNKDSLNNPDSYAYFAMKAGSAS